MKQIKIGILGLGMIFEETYLPCYLSLSNRPFWFPECGAVSVELAAVGSLTGKRWQHYVTSCPSLQSTPHFAGINAVNAMLKQGLDVLCIATPDDRHFEPALQALDAGVHVLIEKPSVLKLHQLEQLCAISEQNQCLAKVIYHKLFDPDHQRLRTLVKDGKLRHINNGYCTLLEPKSISQSQFAAWIEGRNPATYVAIHYVKLIHFTFFQQAEAQLAWIQATGQRGLVGPPNGPTWDSVQLRVGYRYPDLREAVFDIHTSWVHPDDAPGYVEQEVQFRFDNGVWNADQRRRGVETALEGALPREWKSTPNNHYNADLLSPRGERMRRGYGIETIRQAWEEFAYLKWGGTDNQREERFRSLCQQSYNDIRFDRPCVAMVQALEAILHHHSQGQPLGTVFVNHPLGGLVLSIPGSNSFVVLHKDPI